MRTSLLQRTLAVGIGVATVAAVAAPAVAAPGPRPPLFYRAMSDCPAGKVVVGGGAQVVGAGAADFKTSLQETAPGVGNGGAQSLWLTALRNTTGHPLMIGRFAVCAPKPLGYEVVRKDTVVPAGGFLRTTADCPAGKVVLAGGSQVVGEGTADFRTYVQESAPGTFNGGVRSVWLAAMRNFDIQAHTIGVFAVCANRPAGYQVVRKDTSVPGGGFLRTTADCPAGTVVNGGGSSVIGAGESNFGTRMQESAPGITGVPAVSVHMAAVRNGATARTIAVHAVCSRAPAGYEVVRRDVPTG